MHMDKHSTQAWTENPMLLPLMAHCEPLQRRGRSFNKDLAWMLVAERYRIVARSSDVPEHDREAYRWQGFKNGFLNLVASFVVATLQLMNTESLIGCMVTIISVTAYWTYGQYLAAHMNWSIVSLAVVFPITQGIGMGFRRREQALRDLSEVLGCTRSVWEAVHTWKIQPKGARPAGRGAWAAGEWVRAVEVYERAEVRELQLLFHSFLAALITYFDCVRAGRARHTVGWHLEEQAHLFCTLREQRAIVDGHVSQMRRLIQEVKVKGLPGGEAHRIDNYINMIGVGFERLCAIKEYRTPRAFRAFARVYILLVGAMYGPDYIMLARSDDGDESNIIFALVYSCLIQLVMAGLFNVMLGLEDAFARRGGRGQIDSIKVPELVEAARRQMLRIEAEAAQPWGVPAAKEDWHNHTSLPQWHNSATSRHEPLSEQATPAELRCDQLLD